MAEDEQSFGVNCQSYANAPISRKRYSWCPGFFISTFGREHGTANGELGLGCQLGMRRRHRRSPRLSAFYLPVGYPADLQRVSPAVECWYQKTSEKRSFWSHASRKNRQ